MTQARIQINQTQKFSSPAGGTLQSIGAGNDGQWHSYYAPMMHTNLLRGALKRHVLGASACLGDSGGGSDISALRCRARGRNLSSVVAVRDDGDDDGAAAATAAAMAQVRTAVNGAVKNRGLPSIPAPSNKQRQNQEKKKSQPSAEDPVKKNYLEQIHTDDEEHVSPTHLMYTGGQSMPQDVILAQYREQGRLMWRGFTLDQFTNQCFSNDLDLGRGRQMPIHYGSRALNYHTISSPLGTQIPQATGVAYKMKLDAAAAAAKGDSSHDPGVAVCYFGDGCASTTDFHAGLNFAATLSAPVIFFCRNNGYAISTSVEDQYAGDGRIPTRSTKFLPNFWGSHTIFQECPPPLPYPSAAGVCTR